MSFVYRWSFGTKLGSLKVWGGEYLVEVVDLARTAARGGASISFFLSNGEKRDWQRLRMFSRLPSFSIQYLPRPSSSYPTPSMRTWILEEHRPIFVRRHRCVAQKGLPLPDTLPRSLGGPGLVTGSIDDDDEDGKSGEKRQGQPKGSKARREAEQVSLVKWEKCSYICTPA